MLRENWNSKKGRDTEEILDRIALALRLGKTVSYFGSCDQVVGVNVNKGGYHGTTIGR